MTRVAQPETEMVVSISIFERWFLYILFIPSCTSPQLRLIRWAYNNVKSSEMCGIWEGDSCVKSAELRPSVHT